MSRCIETFAICLVLPNEVAPNVGTEAHHGTHPNSRASAPAQQGELIEELMAAGRAMSTATVMFHAAVAENVGLSSTEDKAVELLDRFGPLTAGELVEHSGLTSASVTALIDRLERKGFAKRTP